MVLVHGYAEHAGRYDEMAMYFAERGFAVHAYDQAGHGRSPGPRGHVDRFERLVDELDRFLEQVRLDHPGLPVTLVGHSMGGLVAAATLAFRQPEITDAVLSGSLLQLDGSTGGLRQSLSLVFARILSRVVPRLAFSTGLDLRGLSRDPEVIRRYREDPLVKDRMSVRFASGMSQMVRALRGATDRIDRPLLVLHGGSDPICPALGSQRFYDSLPSDVEEESALQLYPELRHEIFQEPEREQVWRDMLDWLDSSRKRRAEGTEEGRAEEDWQTN